VIQREFERCWPWLEKAIARGRDAGLSKDQLKARLDRNTATLWPGERSAMVTTLEATPAGRFLHVWLAGGDLADLLALRPGVEAWGRAAGLRLGEHRRKTRLGTRPQAVGYARAGNEIVRRL
jgi:hypothetical protein